MCLCGNCTFSRSFCLTFVTKVVKLSTRYMRLGVGRSRLTREPVLHQPLISRRAHELNAPPLLLRPDDGSSTQSHMPGRTGSIPVRAPLFRVSLRHSWRFGANDAAFLRRFLPSCSDPPCQQATACKRRVIPSLVEVRKALVTGLTARGNEIVAKRRPTNRWIKSPAKNAGRRGYEPS